MWHTTTNLITRDPTVEVLGILSNYALEPCLDMARAAKLRLPKTVIVLDTVLDSMHILAKSSVRNLPSRL